MTWPKLARVAAKLLAEEHVDARDPSKHERDRTVDAIRTELSRRAARGRRRRWAFPLVGIAAAVTLVGIGASRWSEHAAVSTVTAPPVRPVPATSVASAADPNAAVVADAVRGTVFVEENGKRVPLRASSVIGRAAKLVAMDGEAIVVLRSGSKIDVEHATVATLVEENETELVDVERGAVTSTVTKRGPTQRFLVRTPDAEVEVRGTIFRVSRLEDPRCGLQTRVHVDEGRVVVRAGQDGATLDAGGEWVSRCLVAPTRSSPPSRAPALAPAPAPTAPVPTAPAPGPTAPAASDLAAQNALFADAMSSKARGDTANALTSLELLLQKYPRTPLREAAEAQRMKLVATADPARAVGLAQAYLLHYPHGFARADAEKIAGALP